MRMSSAILALLLTATLAAAQPRPTPQQQFEQEISGTYTFLQDGEFVQLDVQEGKVGGFVSRFGTQESDKGAFLDHFIKEGALKARELSFETLPVHAVWYTFKGRIERGDAKTKKEQGFYVLRGTLTEFTEDVNKKVTSRSRDVSFKLFPEEEEEDEPGEKGEKPPAQKPPAKKPPAYSR